MPGYQKVAENEVNENVMHSQDVTIRFKESIDALLRATPLWHAGGAYYNNGTVYHDLLTSVVSPGTVQHWGLWIPEGVQGVRCHLAADDGGTPSTIQHILFRFTNLRTSIVYDSNAFYGSTAFVIPAGGTFPWQTKDAIVPGGDYYHVEINSLTGGGGINAIYSTCLVPLWED